MPSKPMRSPATPPSVCSTMRCRCSRNMTTPCTVCVRRSSIVTWRAYLHHRLLVRDLEAAQDLVAPAAAGDAVLLRQARGEQGGLLDVGRGSARLQEAVGRIVARDARGAGLVDQAEDAQLEGQLEPVADQHGAAAQAA